MYEDPGGGGADEAEKPCLSEARLIPTEITFVGVLYACSHCGMVDEGFNYFRMMKEEYGISPRIEHYGHVGISVILV
ncbi:hypothetical protein EV1_022696 [Malus domestica]